MSHRNKLKEKKCIPAALNQSCRSLNGSGREAAPIIAHDKVDSEGTVEAGMANTPIHHEQF